MLPIIASVLASPTFWVSLPILGASMWGGQAVSEKLTDKVFEASGIDPDKTDQLVLSSRKSVELSITDAFKHLEFILKAQFHSLGGISDEQLDINQRRLSSMNQSAFRRVEDNRSKFYEWGHKLLTGAVIALGGSVLLSLATSLGLSYSFLAIPILLLFSVGTYVYSNTKFQFRLDSAFGTGSKVNDIMDTVFEHLHKPKNTIVAELSKAFFLNGGGIGPDWLNNIKHKSRAEIGADIAKAFAENGMGIGTPMQVALRSALETGADYSEETLAPHLIGPFRLRTSPIFAKLLEWFDATNPQVAQIQADIEAKRGSTIGSQVNTFNLSPYTA